MKSYYTVPVTVSQGLHGVLNCACHYNLAHRLRLLFTELNRSPPIPCLYSQGPRQVDIWSHFFPIKMFLIHTNFFHSQILKAHRMPHS